MRLTILIICGFMVNMHAQTCVTLGATPTTSENYIITYTPTVAGITDPTTLPSKTTCQVMQKIQYFDGLGRLLQTLQTKADANADKDLVTPTAYDGYGREVTKYLPYGATGTFGSLRTTAYADQATYYSPSNSIVGVVRTTLPYSQAFLEFSPVSRPLETGAPGTDWQPGAHTIKKNYILNNNIAFNPANNLGSRQVVYYTATINADGSRTLGVSGTYNDLELQVTVTKDENWTNANGSIGTTEQYTDKEGHIVLKRTYNSNGTTTSMLSTYYVYDDFGVLAFVLPPGVTPDAGTTISQTNLDNLCYQYRYDERLRQIQKKIPGKGWEYTIYNTLDQPVATQDANQRVNNQWLFTKYDVNGRVAFTGIWNNGNTAITQAALQIILTGITTNLWETSLTSGSGYTNVAWPTGSVTATLGLNYYDTYANVPGKPATYSAPAGSSTMTRGLLVANQTAVLNAPANLLWKVSYYDDLGRGIKAYTQHYLGGVFSTNNYDAITTTYNFLNAPTTTTRQHWNTTSTTYPLVTIANTYIYDHVGRKVKTWEQITNGNSTPTTKTLLSKVDFNEVGQVTTKHLHSTDSVNFFQNIAYAYNERGWLLQTSAPLFEMQLQYNVVNGITGITPVAQYNGNIASQSWGTSATPNTKSYTYTYDKINRLLSGNSTDNYNEQSIAYDSEGNITGLNRYSANTLIDQLTYTYSNGGNPTNQLQIITDATTSDLGLKHGTSAFTYDGNSNLITDPTKGTGITIAYNILNLPQAITGGKTITYTYDATGQKLRRVSTITGNTDYISGIQYDGTTTPSLTFIQTDEGKAVPSGASYNYIYYLGDNLGNTRITFDTKTGVAANVQQDDYYPFGMEISRSATSPKNEYLFNKKELQEELSEYDYGARFYDPAIARWTSADPLAEKAYSLTPFRYGFNNPVRVMDPDGTYEVDGHFWTVYLMLTMMGNDNAFNISYWTEWPDLLMYPSGDASGSNNSWLQPLSQQRIHALTGGSSSVERASSYASVLGSTTSADLGIALHRLGDSYAHSKVGNESQMYGASFWSIGHSWDSLFGTDPDLISNRPGLYRQYTNQLAGALSARFGFKGKIDMFTFDYVAGSKGSTVQNSAIFETEISIRQGLASFSVEGNEVNAIANYIKSSNDHFGRDTQVKSVYTDVDVYNKDADGNWVKTKSEKRTFVVIQ